MAGQGGKNRKIGRHSRSPSQKRYNAERRWEKNKARRMKKEAARQSVPKNMTVPRGTARAARRTSLQGE